MEKLIRKTQAQGDELVFNQLVDTPNGIGLLKDKMNLGGKSYLTVLHVTKQMTSRSTENGKRLTTNVEDYPTDLWAYPSELVTPAK